VIDTPTDVEPRRFTHKHQEKLMRARILRQKAALLWTAVILCARIGLARTQSAGVSAATITVDSTADAIDANLGDGICATSTGACTLRAALQEANARTGPDIISVPPGIYSNPI
jgi:CSLREA domain-containing protein